MDVRASNVWTQAVYDRKFASGADNRGHIIAEQNCRFRTAACSPSRTRAPMTTSPATYNARPASSRAARQFSNGLRILVAAKGKSGVMLRADAVVSTRLSCLQGRLAFSPGRGVDNARSPFLWGRPFVQGPYMCRSGLVVVRGGVGRQETGRRGRYRRYGRRAIRRCGRK
jgi:hypothetical protein